MRKRNFYASVALVILVFLIVFFGPWHRQANIPAGQSLYASDVYKVSFVYPSNWKPQAGFETDRFSGEDGFFEISAAGTDGSINLSDVVNLEAAHVLSPYGKSPKVETITAGGKSAALVLPSLDQDPSMHGQSALIVAYPEPVSIKNAKYFYFILWADKDHIRSLAKTLKFIE